MKPLDLAQRYLDIFFSGEGLEALTDLLSEDCSFRGPFVNFDSAQDYIASLISDPPRDSSYKIISALGDDHNAIIVYHFSKPGITTPMAQHFEVTQGRISHISLIFDGLAFE